MCLSYHEYQHLPNYLNLGRCFWIIFQVLWQMLFQKAVFVNLSRLVWIIFCFNFKILFWRYILSPCPFRYFSGDVLSPYLPLQILPSNVFPKEPSKGLVILLTGLRYISPCSRHSVQVCSIVSCLLFSFPNKSAQGPARSCWRDVCGPCFLHLQCL